MKLPLQKYPMLLAAVFILGAIGAAAILWQRQFSSAANAAHPTEHGRPATAMKTITAARSAKDASVRKQHRRSPTSRREAAYPAAKAPLVDVFEPLLQRASAGDTTAACRLSLDLSRCANLKNSLAAVEHMTAAMADKHSTTSGPVIDVAASVLNQADDLASMCANVTEAMLDQAYAMQVMAATAGDRRYRQWLASNPALDRQDFLRQLPQWTDYRSRAKAYFDDALRRRNLADLPFLLQVYAPASVIGMRPAYQVHDAATFLGLYAAAARYGIVMPPDIEQAAKTLQAAGQRGRSFDAGWQGTAPGSLMDAVTSRMYPSDAETFCR